MKLDIWLLKKLQNFFWDKFNPNWMKIQCWTGIISASIWCLFTLRQLFYPPYWNVSLSLGIQNGIYFAGRFGVGAYIILACARLLFYQYWSGGD
ncbi:MAG: hypothetical protein AYK18_07110 [Theionarchaea archaeon DG-70]|nr:MAG: hypothetical protein AYK18_07110 [Theionarchaea archaeon DG-70]